MITPQMIRFTRDEAARYEGVQLLGTLSLNAEPGAAGLPIGHVVRVAAAAHVSSSCLYLGF